MNKINKIGIQDENVDIHYPYTSADCVIYNESKNLLTKIEEMDSMYRSNKNNIDLIKENYASKTYVDNEIIKATISAGASVDLSNYATIDSLNLKVDKINGKGLSTNDFTDELKSKLNNLRNYDDSNIYSLIDSLLKRIETLEKIVASGGSEPPLSKIVTCDYNSVDESATISGDGVIIDKTNGTLTITGSNIDFDDSACDLIIS